MNKAELAAVPLGAPARELFPIFSQSKGLAYLDTAASSQKPQVVIDRLAHYLSYEHANIHRGAYRLSAEATRLYDEAREKVARFLGVPDSRCVVFTRSTTESINLVARSFERFLEPGDTILLTKLEHHSNIVPWQMLAMRRGVKVEFANVKADGTLDVDDLAKKLAALKPKLLAITQVSNAVGTIVPLDRIVPLAHKAGTKVLVDGAQAVPHCEVDVAAMDVDFYAFSGHKIYGPTGIGILFGKAEHLEAMDPYMGGGDMIRTVSLTGSTWADIPAKFEAGTPPIGEAIALGTAIDFVAGLGLRRIAAHEHELACRAWEILRKEPGITVYGPGPVSGQQASIVSFNLTGVHAHDIATVADEFNVQLRAGHHCAMPLLEHLGIGSSARISFGVYSVASDIDALVESLRKAKKMFGV